MIGIFFTVQYRTKEFLRGSFIFVEAAHVKAKCDVKEFSQMLSNQAMMRQDKAHVLGIRRDDVTKTAYVIKGSSFSSSTRKCQLK